MRIRFPIASFDAALVARKKSTKLRALDSIQPSATVERRGPTIGPLELRSIEFYLPISNADLVSTQVKLNPRSAHALENLTAQAILLLLVLEL
jgi:hypothetical protein